jgi:hypothetical protein
MVPQHLLEAAFPATGVAFPMHYGHHDWPFEKYEVDVVGEPMNPCSADVEMNRGEPFRLADDSLKGLFDRVDETGGGVRRP